MTSVLKTNYHGPITKHSSNQKVLDHNKKWLTLKSYSLRETYQKCLRMFQQKLYHLLQPTISETFNILTSNEEVFLEKLHSISSDLDKCSHRLYEINLLHCDDIDSNSSEGESDDNDAIDEISLSSSFLSFNRIECAIDPLSPSDFFDTANNQKPCLYDTFQTSSSKDVRMQSVACQCDTLDMLEAKCCQTGSSFGQPINEECQTENFASKMESNAVQTELSYHNDSRFTFFADTHCQSNEVEDGFETIPKRLKSSNLAEADIAPPESSSEEFDSPSEDIPQSENCAGDMEAAEVIKDASDVSSIVNEVFESNGKSSTPFLPLEIQAEGLTELKSELAAFEEYAASQCASTEAGSVNDCSDAIDLLTIHNINKGQRTCVIISHVINPGLFSVQPKGCAEQLIELQKYLNDFYMDNQSNEYAFKMLPIVGTICVALYEDDGMWYRAQITEVLSATECKVMFIDYGDYRVVELKNLREIVDETLQNIPQYSIQCSLCGIEPVCENGTYAWPDAATAWFRQQVLYKLFDVLFVTNYDKSQYATYSVHLLCQENPSSHQSIAATISIANNMISLGYASVSTDARPPGYGQGDPESEKIGQPFVRKMPTVRKADKYRQQTALKSPLKLMKSTIKKETWSVLNPEAKPFNAGNNFSETSSFLMDNLSLDSFGEDDFSQPSDFQQTSPSTSEWDPMRDDFVSERNRYDVNVDDACVAVEKVDPKKAEICKYFARGNCWKGKNCPYPHTTKPDVLYQVAVLSGHQLKEIELEPDETIRVKILTSPKNDDFYVHLLKRGEGDQDDNQSANTKLKQLSRDLKNYYAKVGTRRSVEKQVCIGEVYVILRQKTYCRVTVIDTSKPTRIQVLLVDYGSILTISPNRLIQMNEAFMHTPKQAILCTYEKTTSEVEPLKDCCYFAKVGESLDPVDSPFILALLSKF